jgi:hypothetical protein
VAAPCRDTPHLVATVEGRWAFPRGRKVRLSGLSLNRIAVAIVYHSSVVLSEDLEDATDYLGIRVEDPFRRAV